MTVKYSYRFRNVLIHPWEDSRSKNVILNFSLKSHYLMNRFRSKFARKFIIHNNVIVELFQGHISWGLDCKCKKVHLNILYIILSNKPISLKTSKKFIVHNNVIFKLFQDRTSSRTGSWGKNVILNFSLKSHVAQINFAQISLTSSSSMTMKYSCSCRRLYIIKNKVKRAKFLLDF